MQLASDERSAQKPRAEAARLTSDVLASADQHQPDNPRNARAQWSRGVGELGHSAGVNSVSFDVTGSRIVSGSDDKTVRVWDVATEPEPV